MVRMLCECAKPPPTGNSESAAQKTKKSNTKKTRKHKQTVQLNKGNASRDKQPHRKKQDHTFECVLSACMCDEFSRRALRSFPSSRIKCDLSFFSAAFRAAMKIWLNRNRYLIVAAFQGISTEKEVNKTDQQTQNPSTRT